MFRFRVIPILLHANNGLVKTQRFEKPRYIGDPTNAVRIFNQKQVDELLILDITRSKLNLGPDYELVKKVTAECFMPLSYGGGIRNLSDAKQLFSLGVEKLVIQSAAFRNPQLITEIANFTGSQSVSVSIDVLETNPGEYQIYQAATKQILQTPLSEVVRLAQEYGAGELIITSVIHEGSMQGYNLDLIRFVREFATVPIVAHGGAGSVGDFVKAIAVGADAVAAGSFFVFYGPRKGVLITYPKYEELVRAMGEDDER
jgi:cyclase